MEVNKRSIEQIFDPTTQLEAPLFQRPYVWRQQRNWQLLWYSIQALADMLEARYRTAKAHVDKLTQSILARAFRGELVTTEAELARLEGRDYESASVLLERIRQERAQQQESAKSTPKRTAHGKRDNATKKMFA